MPDFVFDGHKLDYRSYGVGYPLILICTGQLAPELSRRYRVIAIETDDPIEPAALGTAMLGLMDALMIAEQGLFGSNYYRRSRNDPPSSWQQENKDKLCPCHL